LFISKKTPQDPADPVIRLITIDQTVSSIERIVQLYYGFENDSIIAFDYVNLDKKGEKHS
jgi:hypothetical protein